VYENKTMPAFAKRFTKDIKKQSPKYKNQEYLPHFAKIFVFWIIIQEILEKVP
jgi:hypothetical protein